MSGADDWRELLSGRVSLREAEHLWSQGLENLDAFLKADPHAEQRVVEILGRRLRGDINAETWNVMHSSLSQYFSEELAYLLYWVVGVEDPSANRMQHVGKHGSPEVMAFLRAVVGIYGADLSNAFLRWNRHPDNWRNIHREVYYDMLEERHRLHVCIQKFNGEEMVIEGPPDSVLNLAQALIITARAVGTREAFSQRSIDDFLDESRKLIDLLTEEKEQAGAVPSEPEPS